MNAKLIAFIAGTSVGALSAITGIAITAKMFDLNNEDETATNEEQEFFVNSVENYLKRHEMEESKIVEYTDMIEDVCNFFNADYRKFLVSLYDYIVRDEFDMLIAYLDSIQTILKQYNTARWMDTNQAIKSIINGESDTKEVDEEPVEVEPEADPVTEQ